VNRAALIVRPKQPFLDWAAGLKNRDILLFELSNSGV